MSYGIKLDDIQKGIEDIIRTDPKMIISFKSKLVTDEMWEYAIAMEPRLFPLCKKKTYRICMLALARDGFYLSDVDPINYTGDQYKSLCRTAVEQNPKAIAIVPKEFQSKDLVAYAYAQDPELMLNEKKLTPSMLESIIDHNPSLIQYVVQPSDELVIRALERDPRVIVYCKNVTEKVRDYLEETYPQYAAMFLHQ